EISFSMIQADEMSKEVGDSLTLVIDGTEKDFTVSGIYSDITNGGKSAKATFADDSGDMMWAVVPIKLADETLISEKVQVLSETFAFAKTISVDEFLSQTFGSTINAIETASNVSMIISLAVTMLITLLFMKMLVAKDTHSIAVLKTFGFT